MGFPRQEYRSGLPFPSPGDPPNPGIALASPALAGAVFITEPPGKPIVKTITSQKGDTTFLPFLLNWWLHYRRTILFSRSVLSDSLWPHGLQHARLPCPSPTPGAYSNSCPLSRWCHPTISSSVVPFSSHLQSFLASGSFQMSWFFASGGQSIGVRFSISSSNEYSGLISFRIDWLDLLAVQGTLKSLLQH